MLCRPASGCHSRRPQLEPTSVASDWLVGVSDKRRVRHHVVPRLHLRHFADGTDRVVQLDLDTGARRQVSIADAAVIRNFYTLVLPDGSRTDAWERWLAELEDQMAPALKRAISMPTFDLPEEDRVLLSRWIGLQYLRGPDNRRRLTELASFAVRTQVGMGGLEYLRHAMAKGLGRPVSDAEVEHVWNDVTSDAGPAIAPSADAHLQTLTTMIDRAAAMVHERSWMRVRFNRHRLAVADVPVCLVPGETPDQAGLAGAPALTVPLSREVLLWLELPGPRGPLADRDGVSNALRARVQNEISTIGAERFLYFHPSDDPIPQAVEIPREKPLRLRVSNATGMINRDRPLSDVLAQIANSKGQGTAGLIADYTWPIPGYHPPRYEDGTDA